MGKFPYEFDIFKAEWRKFFKKENMFTLSIIIVLEDQTNRGRSDHWIEQDAVIVTTTKGISK